MSAHPRPRRLTSSQTDPTNNFFFLRQSVLGTGQNVRSVRGRQTLPVQIAVDAGLLDSVVSITHHFWRE